MQGQASLTPCYQVSLNQDSDQILPPVQIPITQTSTSKVYWAPNSATFLTSRHFDSDSTLYRLVRDRCHNIPETGFCHPCCFQKVRIASFYGSTQNHLGTKFQVPSQNIAVGLAAVVRHVLHSDWKWLDLVWHWGLWEAPQGVSWWYRVASSVSCCLHSFSNVGLCHTSYIYQKVDSSCFCHS